MLYFYNYILDRVVPYMHFFFLPMTCLSICSEGHGEPCSNNCTDAIGWIKSQYFDLHLSVDQFTHFIHFLKTEWNSFPNLSHFLDIYETLFIFQIHKISLWITQNIAPSCGTSIQYYPLFLLNFLLKFEIFSNRPKDLFLPFKTSRLKGVQP